MDVNDKQTTDKMVIKINFKYFLPLSFFISLLAKPSSWDLGNPFMIVINKQSWNDVKYLL